MTELSEVMNMFYILYLGGDYRSILIHEKSSIEHLRSMNFTMCKISTVMHYFEIPPKNSLLNA